MIETFIPEWSSNRQVKDRHQQIEKDPLTVAGAEGRSRLATIPALVAGTMQNADALPLESPSLPGRVSPQWQLQESASGNGDPPLTVAGAEGGSRLATIPALVAGTVRNADALPLESPALPGRVSPQWQLQGSASGNGDPPLTVAGAEGRSRLATIPALAAWAVRVRSIAAHNVPSRPSEANGYCASQSARYNLL